MPKLRQIALGLAVGALVSGGCVVVKPPHAGARAAKCPPGHQWSDGKCHSKGKGHDPNHQGKGKGKDKD